MQKWQIQKMVHIRYKGIEIGSMYLAVNVKYGVQNKPNILYDKSRHIKLWRFFVQFFTKVSLIFYWKNGYVFSIIVKKKMKEYFQTKASNSKGVQQW